MKNKSMETLVVEILLFIVALIVATMGFYLIGKMWIVLLFKEWREYAIVAILVMLPAILFWTDGLIRVSKRIGFNIARLKQ